MERQTELFHEPLEVVSPAQDRLEPHVWVRRMVIWEEPGKVIRDLPMRKGLNIIWSPDPGADAVGLGESAGSGHGAGKTLFCRLLRYCLGEERFANDALRHSISQELPSGLIGAEVMVGGNLWTVIRPLGITRKHWAIEGKTPEEVLESDFPQTGMEPLLDAISSPLIPNDLEIALPGTASRKGCGLSHKLTDVDQIEGDKAHVQEQIKQCNAAAAGFKNQKIEKELLLKQIETELEAVQAHINTIQKKDQETRDDYMGRKFNADNLVKQATKLNAFLNKKTELELQRENRTKDNKKYGDQLSKLREQHKAAMTKFNELFRYVSKGFLGSETTAKIALTGSGLEAQVQVGGLAMTSLKAVVFDLAALLLTIEGRSHLPAFLLHDSPREADLGLSYYHKLFLFVRKLEAIADDPPFQYIVTTTTEPPKSLIDTECHIVTLDGADPERRLLKRDLLGDS